MLYKTLIATTALTASGFHATVGGGRQLQINMQANTKFQCPLVDPNLRPTKRHGEAFDTNEPLGLSPFRGITPSHFTGRPGRDDPPMACAKRTTNDNCALPVR